MRSWIRATTLRTFLRSRLPHFCLASFLCPFARAFSSRRKKRGFSMNSPLESAAKVLRPTLTPTASSLGGRCSASTSWQRDANPFPLMRGMVQFLTSPHDLRCILALPSFGNSMVRQVHLLCKVAHRDFGDVVLELPVVDQAVIDQAAGFERGL